MSLIFLKLSGSSTSDSFVPGAFWRKSLNSLKIQSWHLTTWNAEENPNCHGASVSSAGISCLLRSDWLLECGRDSGSSDSSVSPFCTHSVHAVSTVHPWLFACWAAQWAISKRCKDSQKSLWLESLFCSSASSDPLFIPCHLTIL